MTDEHKSQDLDKVRELTGARDIEEHITRSLDDSLNEISDHARQRLYAARQQALRQARTNSPKTVLRWGWQDWWKPAVPVAAGIAFVGVIFFLPPNNVTPSFNSASEQEMELLFSDDDLEMLEELEFYAWLAEVESG